jgi:subfamily B ATP-binding cassette protein MsbA
MVAVAVASTTQTYLMGPLIDKVFIARDSSLLWLIAGGILAIFALRSLARFLQEVLLIEVGQKIVATLQGQLAAKLLHDDMAALQSRPPGSLAAAFTYDANMVRLAVCDVFLTAGKDTLTIVTMIGLMFFTDWRMALVCLVLPVLSVAPMKYLGRKMRVISLRTQTETGNLAQTLTQAFQAIRTIKSYRLEDMQQARANGEMTMLARLVVKGAWVGGAILPVVDGLGGLAVATVIIYGGSQVLAGALTPGDLVVFVGAIVGAYAPIPSLSKVNAQLQTGLAAAERVFGLMDRTPTVAICDGAAQLPRMSGAVRFEGVRFAYGEGEEAALRGTDFTAPAGAVTALVGRTGAGKSTVLNLILRFYDPDEGRVVINGVDIREVSQASLRDNIAVVSQEVALFDDTAANNVRYGKPGATDEEVQAAIQAAGAADFLAALPQGLETRLGEGGVRLSGGQRQRIAIARAILKDAPILLLDEATSAQDPESERQIQKALKQLMWGRTTIVVAHRMATIRDAEVIHVLDNGKVVESGSHDELILEPNLYAHLHDLQAPPNSDRKARRRGLNVRDAKLAFDDAAVVPWSKGAKPDQTPN